MSTLLSLLEQESRWRNLLPAGETLTPATAFALVRDIPYQRASSRQPEAIIQEWRGTCSGKHYALDRIFRQLGMDSRVIMCTHRFTLDNTGHFPPELRALVAQEPVPDVHTYLRLKTIRGWMTVDATWPGSAEPLGMPVNRWVNDGENMNIACDPIDTYEVLSGQDPQAFKEQLIAEFCGASGPVRDDFIEGMSRWLSNATQGR
ncbi:MAG: hypothetical protein J4G13_00275 [Dehalococcoidia bacterium]|nr:hypothetical protein [Dehalococcoidia bacterium]